MPDLESVVAANIRGERARLKWTQAQLGELVGMSGSTLSDLENGNRIIATNELPLFCRALNITFAQLVQRADPDDIRALGI